ncbi:MAG: IS3 family transposase [Proteobacteria bacterium]|nr:IS3 family transposase [Pseudomonadota bacterium]
MESFSHTLKTEQVYFETYKTRKQPKSSIFVYIEVFYIRKRSYSAPGFVSPECYEQQLLAKCG